MFHPYDIDEFKNNLKSGNIQSYKIHQSNQPHKIKNKDFVPTFTFVRNPLQRFESSLSEAVWRTDQFYKSNNNMSSLLLNSTDSVKKYIKEILNIEKSSLQEIFHIFSMSGVLFRYKLDIIGYLESFKKDYENKILPAYNTHLPFNDQHGVHATSVNHPLVKLYRYEYHNVGDTNNLRFYYRKLIKEEPAYLRALCNIYLIDYVCLPKYELPAGCKYLESIRAEGVSIVTSTEYSPSLDISLFLFSLHYVNPFSRFLIGLLLNFSFNLIVMKCYMIYTTTFDDHCFEGLVVHRSDLQEFDPPHMVRMSIIHK